MIPFDFQPPVVQKLFSPPNQILMDKRKSHPRFVSITSQKCVGCELAVMVCVVSQVTELECVSAQTSGIKTQKTELNQTIEELEAELKAKEQVRRL